MTIRGNIILACGNLLSSNIKIIVFGNMYVQYSITKYVISPDCSFKVYIVHESPSNFCHRCFVQSLPCPLCCIRQRQRILRVCKQGIVNDFRDKEIQPLVTPSIFVCLILISILVATVEYMTPICMLFHRVVA